MSNRKFPLAFGRVGQNRAVVAQDGAKQPESGQVFLVGAGPGEPGAITLRALECLGQADAVLYDYLVNPALLRWANRPNVRLISLGGHGGQEPGPTALAGDLPTPRRLMSQGEVSALMVKLAKEGQTVVRLKCGDPLIFARAAEEIAALQSENLRFEVVPGITSALAAGSYAGIPLTHREHASAVALVTGHPAAENQPVQGTTAESNLSKFSGDQATNDVHSSNLDWKALAVFPGTLVVYMGTTQLEYWVGELLRYGKLPSTPVAILRRCGFSDQSVTHTTLGHLIETATIPKRIRPPVVFVIGSAAAATHMADWFEQRPLRGQTILVTRPVEDGSNVLRELELLGAQTLQWPAISILPLDDFSELDSILQNLSSFGWVVFNSPNGVRAFLERLWTLGLDLRALGPCRLAAVGRQTGNELAKHRLRCDLIPDQFSADHLATALIEQARTEKCLIVRASRGRDVLPERLRAAGVAVTQVVAYRQVDNCDVPPEIKHALQNGKVHWITVTSNAIADNLVRQLGDDLVRAKLVSISPLTSQRLREHGLQVAAEAKEATFAGVVQAILADRTADSPK
jgi:uroporphyrinogen III methyltransferase/synthase